MCAPLAPWNFVIELQVDSCCTAHSVDLPHYGVTFEGLICRHAEAPLKIIVEGEISFFNEMFIAVREYAEAGRIFSGMIATAPRNAAVHVGLGVALAIQGDERGAEGAWREALRLDPAAREAHENLAHLFARRGKSEEAARELCLSGIELASPRDREFIVTCCHRLCVHYYI